MRFGVLGPLRVTRDGLPVAVGGPKQQRLLVLLLVRHNRPCSADWLVDALWDGRPPASAEVTLRTYVAGLRRALEPDRRARASGGLVRNHPGGYELRVPPGAIDFVEFTDLVRGAGEATDPVVAEGLYADALALWRGDPADVAAVRPEFERLAEARVSAEEGRFAAAVAAGHAPVAELRRFVAAHPERETARARLMLALYRAGRQAEALAVYAEGRRLLVEEYGVEPGAELREAHRRVLDHDVPPPSAVSGPARPGRGAPAGGAGLVGRVAELAVLDDLLAASLDSGRVVAVVGEAGIGKTSLARAVGERAAAAGVPVVWGRCPDLGQAPPFWLWAQVVRALVASPRAGAAGRAAALAGFADGPLADSGVDPAARFRTYEAVADLVRAVAAPAGLVVVLDDLHAADRDSLLLLRFLSTTVHTGRTLVVATLRPYEHDPDLVAALADLARAPGFRQVRPAGLDAGAVADLVRRSGVEPSPGLVHGLVERTGGNPFFITELLSSADPAGGEPPPGVRDTVRVRLNALDDATRDCLDLLAVAGRDLGLHVLARAAGVDVAPLLARPGAAHLVAEAGPGVVRFRHPLFAQAAYADLAPPRRAALHARLADAGVDVLTRAELAHHYGQAVGLGRGEDHLRWTLAAAEDATLRLAYEDALAHLDRAAALLGPSPARELDVHLRRVALLQITVGVGSDAVERAAARARALLPHVDTDPRPALWALGELACNRAEFALAADLARRLVGGEGLVHAAGHYLLGVVGYFTGRLAEADADLGAAAERLRDLGPRRLVGQAGRTPTLSPYNFRALVRSLRGDGVAARSDLAAARDLADRADDPYGRANAALFTAWLALQEQDVELGGEAARRCREIGERQGMRHFVTTGDFVARWAAVRGGRGGVEAMLSAGEGIYRLGLRSTRTITTAAMADACLVAGRPAEARRLAEDGLALAEATGERVLAAELRRVRALAAGDAAGLAAAAELAAAQGARLLADRVEAASTRFPRRAGELGAWSSTS
ncbi:BTAD domain-containing putative transcriptional regulator [Actinosynnema sp. NPDC053489]|uniref:BTAD domain-containing putative transcriptional regulator n=1 Tax=Actinosynnema sp. NPDC053489 TaxID=3363916 RepID=UPI0037CA2B64